jgi:hypothetical protein
MIFTATVFSIYALTENYAAGKEGEWESENDGNIFMSGSLAAYGEDDHPSLVQPWLNLALGLVLYGIYVFVWFKHKRLL